MKERIKRFLGGCAVVMSMMLATSVNAAPSVTILDAGTGAKKVLRLEATHPHTQHLVMLWNMNMVTQMGTMNVPIDLPQAEASIAVTTLPQTTDDTVHYSLELSRVGLSGEGDNALGPLIGTMRQEMQQLTGTVSKGVMKRSGESVSMNMAGEGASKKMADQLSSAMTQSLVILPDSPVGLGAKWSITEEVDQQGVRFERTTNVELKSMKGSVIELALTLGGKPLSTEINSPELPPGAKAELVSLKVNGGGTVVYDLADLFPQRSTLDVQLATQMVMEYSGESMDVRSTIGFNFSLQSQ